MIFFSCPRSQIMQMYAMPAHWNEGYVLNLQSERGASKLCKRNQDTSQLHTQSEAILLHSHNFSVRVILHTLDETIPGYVKLLSTRLVELGMLRTQAPSNYIKRVFLDFVIFVTWKWAGLTSGTLWLPLKLCMQKKIRPVDWLDWSSLHCILYSVWELVHITPSYVRTALPCSAEVSALPTQVQWVGCLDLLCSLKGKAWCLVWDQMLSAKPMQES